MKLTAPKYYHNFKCIADKCSHSCCIGWEIDVDEVTIEKYTSLSGDYADISRVVILRIFFCATVKGVRILQKRGCAGSSPNMVTDICAISAESIRVFTTIRYMGLRQVSEWLVRKHAE